MPNYVNSVCYSVAGKQKESIQNNVSQSYACYFQSWDLVLGCNMFQLTKYYIFPYMDCPVDIGVKKRYREIIVSNVFPCICRLLG